MKNDMNNFVNNLKGIGVEPSSVKIDHKISKIARGVTGEFDFVTIEGFLTKPMNYAKDTPIELVVTNKENGVTIVKFKDGEVSKVKCNNEDFDVEKAIAIAVCKYFIGNNAFYKAINNALVIEKKEAE